MDDPIFERRVEQFKNKIQQHINLADDEIARLTSYLTTVKGDIEETKDKLNRMQIKLAQTSHEVAGRNKRNQAILNTKIAKLKYLYNMKKQECQSDHNKNISTIQEEFQKMMDSIHSNLKEKVNQETAPIEDEIQKTTTKLQMIQSTIAVSTKVLDETDMDDMKSIQQVELAQQKQLEKAIQKRSQERLDSMLQAKSRLGECVSTLDEMERAHTTQMNKFKVQLDALDIQYQSKLKRENDKHTKMMETLQRKNTESEKRNGALQQTINKIAQHHKMQIASTRREGEHLQLSIKTQEMQTELQSKEEEKSKKYTEKLLLLKQKLESKENQLTAARTENESLKREVNRLKHEARVAKRRQSRATFSQI